MGKAQWPKVPLKYLTNKIGSGKTPKGGAEVYVKSGVMLLRSQNVHFDGLRIDDVVFIDDGADEDMRSTRVQPNDVLLNITGASIGRCTIVPPSFPSANVNQHVCIIRVDEKRLLPEYLNAVLQSDEIQTKITSSENGSSREGLNFEQIGAFEIEVPPVKQQVQLVDQLNARLDVLCQLIETKRTLLGTLSEKRSALITHAVTQGLDPKVPMKDSGISWLGKIPVHWETERTKWVLPERDERSESGEEELLTVSHLTGVTRRSAKDVNMFEAESLEGYKKCEPGDLAINTLWAWMGAMGVAREPGVISPAYNVYKIVPRLDPEFVDLVVRTPRFVEEVTRFSKGVWSSRLRLYPEGLYEVSFPLPPRSEQQAIVAHIQLETRKIDNLAAATEGTIALLQERRSALISAAVTGQMEIGDRKCE